MFFEHLGDTPRPHYVLFEKNLFFRPPKFPPARRESTSPCRPSPQERDKKNNCRDRNYF